MKKKKSNRTNNDQKQLVKVEKYVYTGDVTLKEFADACNLQAKDIVTKLFQSGLALSLNDVLSKENVELLCLEFDILFSEELDEVIDNDLENLFNLADLDPKKLKKRAPVVTIMGHVDHGKTTLLDTIRSSRVASSEAGGITQHIGAYQVKRKDSSITFIDTPGHEAFSEMRARGASVTDIVVLVVAADDGIMPQTIEAITHAKASNCPIIVAINKIDKPEANPQRIMEELTRYELVPEEWGGDTICLPISALKGEGIDKLLDAIDLMAEILELKSDPTTLACGTVIEAGLDKFKGATATLLVQAGTLNKGDVIVCGTNYGKIRSMEDNRGKLVTKASPSEAYLVTGLNGVPLAGDQFKVFLTEHEARDVAAKRDYYFKQKSLIQNKKNLYDIFKDGEAKVLNIIIKSDAEGSSEALKNSLLKIENSEVKLNILRSLSGTISLDDLNLALGSNALVIGFNVRPLPQVRKMADEKKIDIRLYNVIYDCINDVDLLMKGMLEPVFKEESCGFASIKEIFTYGKLKIAGCMVDEGYITNSSIVRLLRDGKVVYEGKISSLKRFKDDAKKVTAGFDCGLCLENYNDIKIGDVLECSILKEVSNE